MDEQSLTDQSQMDDAVVCVTGGAGGIGTAIGRTVASLGADVAVADIDIEGARETAALLADATGTEAVSVATDVSSHDAALEMVEQVTTELGPIDVLVNNAGVATYSQFVDSSPADWQKWLGVSLFGTLNCTHAVLPSMIERGDGSVINFASGSYTGNDPGMSVYGAAKAANVSFTKTVAKEVGPDGVRVNCVSPGTVRTPATDELLQAHEEAIAESYALERVGEPEEIANTVALLASDAMGWVTGEVVHVDGGYLRG